MPWSVAEIRRHVQQWTAYHTVRVHVHWSALGPAERGPREERPSEARILDALDTLAVRHVVERGPGPFALAAALLMFEAVDELRRERGFIAAPAEDLPPIPRQIGYRVFTDLEAAVIAQPMMPWAHDLSVQVRARELAAVPKPSAGPRWPARRPRTFQAMMAERLGAGAIDALMPRVAVALRDAEAQAIVDLRRGDRRRRAAGGAGATCRRGSHPAVAVSRSRDAPRVRAGAGARVLRRACESRPAVPADGGDV